MNKVENLLTTVSEECGEIIQAVSKYLRFGPDNHSPDDPSMTNEKQLMIEYYQLRALIEYMQSERILPAVSEAQAENIMVSKIMKVQKYQEYSAKIGLLSKDKFVKDSMPIAYFTDLDGTVICNEYQSRALPIAVKDGNTSSWIYRGTLDYISCIAQDITTFPITTRCRSSFENINPMLTDNFSSVFVENGAILLNNFTCDSNKNSWNEDIEWTNESREIIKDDKAAFDEARALLKQMGYMEKWDGVEFTLDCIQDRQCRGVVVVKEAVKQLNKFQDVLLIRSGNKSICCTYKKLSKGETIKRYCEKFGYYPFLSSGDGLEDSSMFEQTKYSIGKEGSQATHIVNDNSKLGLCYEFMKTAANIIQINY